ncbi:16S rRNA (adenine(1518)-N(6)/adenine(1519)-N(6))-dimethyltransferase RsmA [Prosthecochloris sp. HL-130-GSB]|jgi:16S rRNA (adenine1518-N6/adenine1519-N6)-dimethyltransferase|uniref:16S rRNA (adenine(1518)-N(6)/adenine(1519)-N(6))- dimethyltransferase RsmA n=1 Tax=Prosthecochloris sp. HL-130-GSB TaxID=1974213 RepID=UPI000A1C0B27|nr:16S rRNA (adenine(1518)-N(6)/adenine(1519)-N(6))-dimethyltransferase RsmA [Prosthecochloris sp. HL-130-GSB]ARM31046.1 ribosomal RNA small subunit methyltransferase A [Prosthecochloris sp. HL-130-GSB]
MTKVEYKHTEIAVKKKLGQNFLTDRNIIRKIIRSADLKPGDRVVEIGPGFGALTGEIATICPDFTAIEKDPALAEFIRNEFPSVNLIEHDVLKVNLEQIADDRKIKVIGNIPYSITSPILFKLLEHRHCIQSETLMMQQEVALRLAARPGTKEYGILAVQLQTFCEVTYLFKVGKQVFRPKPEVDSAVVSIVPRQVALDRYQKEYSTLVRRAFQQRRKTLNNNLKKEYDLSGVTGIDLHRRAESLEISEFETLFSQVKAFR